MSASSPSSSVATAVSSATHPMPPAAGRQKALAEARTAQVSTVRARKEACADAEEALGTAPPWLRWLMSLRLSWSRNRLSRAKNSAGAHRTMK